MRPFAIEGPESQSRLNKRGSSIRVCVSANERGVRAMATGDHGKPMIVVRVKRLVMVVRRSVPVPPSNCSN